MVYEEDMTWLHVDTNIILMMLLKIPLTSLLCTLVREIIISILNQGQFSNTLFDNCMQRSPAHGLHGKPNLTSDIKGKFLSQRRSFVFLLPLINIDIKHLNPFHPYISMHILHTVLYTFLQFWKGELLQQSRASLVSDQVLYSHDQNVLFRGDIMRRN